MKYLRIIKQYTKDRILSLLVILVFIISFLITYYLEKLPIQFLLYPLIIGGTLALLVYTFDFYRYIKKHNRLSNLLHTSSILLTDLPESASSIEKMYQDIIFQINRQNQNLLSLKASTQQEIMDYYTLWVHQIKTPISALRLAVETMDSSQAKSILQQETFKIEQYVDMVLTYLRLDSIHSDLTLSIVDIYKTTLTAIRKLSPVFIHRNIALKIEPFSLSTLTDEKWLAFVIEQLLSNALKYTHRGSITVSIGMNSLVIQDSGIGIQSEDLPLIFQRGFTGYNGRLHKKASGLGLFLVKKILDTLGHTITITSEITVGTRIEIDFSRKDIEIE